MKEVSIKCKEIDKENKENFKVVNRVCLIYSIGIFIIFLFNLFMDYISLKYDYPKFIFIFAKNLFQFLLFFWLLRCFASSVDQKDLEGDKDEDFGIKKNYQFLLINFGLHYIFFCFGWLINEMAAKILPPLLNKLIELFHKNKELNASPVIRNENGNLKYFDYFVICVTGPIFEEYTYRYFLIKRLATYDIKLSIFCSGIIFGYVHMSADKFFDCMASGIVYAYSYVKTNNIFTPIAYHIFLNSYDFFFPGENEKFPQLILGIIGLVMTVFKEDENFCKGCWTLYKSICCEDCFKICCALFKSCCVLFKSYSIWICIVEGNLIFLYYYYEKAIN